MMVHKSFDLYSNVDNFWHVVASRGQSCINNSAYAQYLRRTMQYINARFLISCVGVVQLVLLLLHLYVGG